MKAQDSGDTGAWRPGRDPPGASAGPGLPAPGKHHGDAFPSHQVAWVGNLWRGLWDTCTPLRPLRQLLLISGRPLVIFSDVAHPLANGRCASPLAHPCEGPVIPVGQPRPASLLWSSLRRRNPALPPRPCARRARAQGRQVSHWPNWVSNERCLKREASSGSLGRRWLEAQWCGPGETRWPQVS